MDEEEDLNVLDVVDEEYSDSKGKSRRNYTNDFKKSVVAYAQRTNNSCAAKKYGVDRACVQRWLKNIQKITEESDEGRLQRKRVKGGGRPLLDKDFDENMKLWITEQRRQKLRISRRIIKLHAAAYSKDPNFSASNGWLSSFMKRHGLSLRRPTTVCQKPPEAFQETIIDFLLYVENLRIKNDYSHIYACDETAVYLDFSKSLTIDQKGARQVSVKTTGHDKLHITVMLTARHDGYKCRPFVLLPYKRPKPDIIKKFGSKLELSWAGRTFFNDELTIEYLKRVLGTTLFGRRLLVWDSYRCHISQETKKELRVMKLDTATIPGGTTKFIQAPDVYWNSPFKSNIGKMYEDWMIDGQKSYTANGNMRPPPMEVYLQWIVDAWECLPNDLIQKSFKGCGLNNSLSGSEDDLIHCFKPAGEMPEGKDRLRAKREDQDSNLNDMEDLFDEIDISEDHETDSDVPLDYE